MRPLRTSTQFLRTLNSLRSPLTPIPSQFRTMASSAMSKRLEGKTIVITGASSGIGRSTAIEFARTSPKNLRLILTARRIDTLKEIAAEIKKEVGEGVKVLPFKLDVSNPEEVRSFVGNLPEEWREIDVLVNNA
jgi:3-hydroxy acid dehydrogenase / malonic semialdehyde reductase